MVSRIDIGPDGGPYVAINENSNDLELQDINGNVIAKWDETAGQWDLNNNSLTGINAIDASSATLEQADTRNGYESKSTPTERDVDEWFQNTSGADLNLIVFAQAAADDTSIFLEVDVNDEQSSNVVMQNRRNGMQEFERIPLGEITIPNGFYYRVQDGLGTSDDFSLSWREQI